MTRQSRVYAKGAGIGVMVIGCVMPVAADAATLAGNLPSWVASAAQAGTASDNQSVDIAVHMTLQNIDGLTAFVAAISKPGSAQYGKYLTAAEFGARFAPATADVAAVKAMLSGAGMSNIQVGPLGAYISATATVRQLRTTFHVSQDLYRFGGMTMRANKEAPTIPSALAGKILYVEGLDDTDRLRQPEHISVTQGPLTAPAGFEAAMTASSAAAVTPPPVAAGNPSPYCDTYAGDLVATLSTKPAPYSKTIPWLICGYTPQQIQAAYGLNPFSIGLDGAGVTVAIVDAYASPTLEADGNRYAANHGLPKLTSANFKQVIPAGIYDVPAADVTEAYGWWGEQSLDIAAVHGSAPGASVVYVGGENSGAGLTTALLDTIYDHRADIITNSWGEGGDSDTPADIAMYDQSFMAAAAEGITVLFSSGDDGDLSQLNGVATSSLPGDSPYATGVGGTSLLLKNALGSKSEYGWGNDRDLLANATVNSARSITTSGLATVTDSGLTYDDFAFYAGSGGGLSLVEPQPDYQVPVVPTALATTLNEAAGYTVPLSPRRVSPDISAVADPYTGYLYGETFTIAGNAILDAGCTKTTATTEYCEGSIGGTSLASPVTAGVIATVNQIRGLTGRSFVGFANPWLYSLKTGKTTDSAGLNQILPPATPTAVLRGYATDLNEVRVVTINSVPLVIFPTPFPLEVCATTICEGIDDVFNFVTPGYNDVTGLGVPYVPLLALSR